MGSKILKRNWLIAISVFTGLALITAACSHSSRTSSTETTAPPTTSQSECDNVTLEATEIGVTPTKIKLQVMADVGSTLSPGLFQGAFDGTKVWVDYVNEQGGLACRQLELEEWDSKINPVETVNGFLNACDNALAQVGSNALFAFNVTDLNTCPDKAGNPIGLPDFAEGAAEPSQQCSPNVFLILGGQGACPFVSGEERVFEVQSHLGNYLSQEFGTQRCAYAIPSDIPSTISITMPGIRAANLLRGTINAGELGFTGRTPQSGYGELIKLMKDNNATCASNSSDSNALLKWRSETNAQGGLDDVKWLCFYQCYTSTLLEQNNVGIAEGTYMWLPFLPYSERDVNAELDLFLTRINKDFPDVWAALSWGAGRLFEQILRNVVEEHGLNGITRANIFAEARSLDKFNANGWFGDINFKSKPNISQCTVIVQVENGEFVRKDPPERGTLDCNPANRTKILIDSPRAFAEGPSYTGTLVTE